MTLRTSAALVAALLFAAPSIGRAALAPYNQDFESLDIMDLDALTNDGWLVFGNVFDATGTTYLYGYGPFPAPNTGAAFCAIATGEGGIPQGSQQLSVYSDYNNTGAHGAGQRVESNTYQEQMISAADVGSTWNFQFDAKLGNLGGTSTALAFIKVLDPAAGYALTDYLTVNTTATPTTWSTYTISIPITSEKVGRILQIGFSNNATSFQPSGIFYDNVGFTRQIASAPGTPLANALELRPATPNPFRTTTQIAYSLPRASTARLGVFDITGRRVATLFSGPAEAGTHVASWSGRTADGSLAPAGVYRYVLDTDAGRVVRSMVLAR